MFDHSHDVRRRELLATTAVTVLAGCTGGDGGGTGEQSTSTSEQSTKTTISGGTTQAAETETTTTATEEQATEQASTADVVLGEVVEDQSLGMVVRSVERTKTLGQFQEAGQGNTYVVVRMAVKNKGSSQFVDFNSFWQTRLKDGQNHVYDQAIAATENPMSNGQLAPGEVARGDLAYEVPEGASGLELQFDFSAFRLFSFSRVSVALEQEADSIADLDQSLQVQTHAVGDTVSTQDLTVTLEGVRTTESLDTYTTAEEGMEFVIPDISVTNESGEAVSVSILLQMVVKDQRGQAYTVHLGSYSALDQKFAQGSQLAPGETRRGEISYQIHKDASGLLFAVEFSLLVDGDKTFWTLG